MDKIAELNQAYTPLESGTALNQAVGARRAAAAELADAEKKAKRSPAKWLPVVAVLDGRLTAAQSIVDRLTILHEQEREAQQEARHQERIATAAAVLAEFGGRVENRDNGDFLITRVSLTTTDAYKIGLWTHDGAHFEVGLIEAGSDKQVFGYSVTVYAPESRRPAHISTGSYSGMDTNAKARTTESVHHLALMLSETLNQAYGVEEPTEVC